MDYNTRENIKVLSNTIKKVLSGEDVEGWKEELAEQYIMDYVDEVNDE